MKPTTKTILALTAATLCLSACGQTGSQAGNAISGAITSATGAEASAGEKLDGYIEAHNKFIDTFGFQEKAEDYRKADIAHASTDGNFNVGDGWIGQGLDKLKKARALSGGAADLDTAADALIGSMGKVRTHLADLATYYDGKKYLDDKLARGKREDPQMLAEIAAAEKDFEKFNALLDREMGKRDQAVLEKLKSSGKMLKYNTKLALVHAKALIDIFGDTADIKGPGLFVRGDAEVAIIEKAVADAHQEATKAGKSDPTGLSSLTSMVGAYRSFKQSHQASDAESMTRSYNLAVDSANIFGNAD